jgi:lysophospholipase L1-like esterase
MKSRIIIVLLGVAVFIGLLLTKLRRKVPLPSYGVSVPVTSGSIVFIGDSRTTQFAVGDYFPTVKVSNQGISGDSTSHLLLRIIPILRIHPGKIFLEIGVNDVVYCKKRTIEDIYNCYTKIIDTIEKITPTSKIYVTLIFPVKNKPESINTRISILNSMIAENCNVVNKHFKNIIIIDMTSALLQSNTYYKDDGLHLNQNGYLLWANTIRPYVN